MVHPVCRAASIPYCILLHIYCEISFGYTYSIGSNWFHRPILTKPERFESARLYHDMIVEMVLAFFSVSFLQSGIILHDFLVTSRPKISAAYEWIAPMGLWVFSMSWMVTYTMHIPFAYQRGWQWAITAFFIVFNFLVSNSPKV